MSQFASSQANTLSSLSRLAQRAGEGQAFNQRFSQEQQLQGDLLRQRQMGNQAAAANADRQVRLQQLAAQNEATRFQQALAAEKEQRNAVRQEQESSIQERQRDLSNAFKIRDMERMEAQLGVRQQGEERLQQQQDQRAEARGQPPAPGSKEFNRAQRDAVGELANIAKLLDPIGGPDLDDETRISLEQRRDSLNQGLVDLQETAVQAARNISAEAQVRQQQGPVTAKEAGPALSLSLKAARQTRVLEPPINTETGRADIAKFKVGKIYQTPDGPAVFMGGQSFDLIDELDDVDKVRNSQPR